MERKNVVVSPPTSSDRTSDTITTEPSVHRHLSEVRRRQPNSGDHLYSVSGKTKSYRSQIRGGGFTYLGLSGHKSQAHTKYGGHLTPSTLPYNCHPSKSSSKSSNKLVMLRRTKDQHHGVEFAGSQRQQRP